MKEFNISSRIITSVRFGAEDGRLYLTFKNGEQRLFAGLSEGDVSALVRSESPGLHYIQHIRERFRRLDPCALETEPAQRRGSAR